MDQLRRLRDDSMNSELFFRPFQHLNLSIFLDPNDVHAQVQSVTGMKNRPFDGPMTLHINTDLSRDVENRRSHHRIQFRRHHQKGVCRNTIR